MKVIKFYGYPKCSTCNEAFKFLTNNRYAVERIDIFEKPPSKAELKKMLELQGGNIKKILNTMGHVYRETNLKDEIAKMTEDEVLTLLAKNGKLIKRPFILFEDKGLVGFEKAAWKKVFTPSST